MNTLTKNKKITLTLVLYLVLLTWVVVFKCSITTELNVDKNLAIPLKSRFAQYLVPFSTWNLYGNKIKYIAEVLLNVVVFVPFGFLMRFFISSKKTLIAIIATTLFVEFFQLFSCLGGFDTADLLTNVAGTGIGIVIFNLLADKIPQNVADKTCTAINVVFAPVAIFAVFTVFYTVVPYLIQCYTTIL